MRKRPDTRVALIKALDEHLDERERPLVAAINRIASTQGEMLKSLQAIERKLDTLDRGVKALNTATVEAIEGLREDLRGQGIETRKPSFKRSAA